MARRVVRRGHEVAVPEDGYTLHVEPRGLRSDAGDWYRFKAGGEISPVGRTRTAPHPWQRPRRLRFASASCQNYQDRYYTAHRALAGEDLAFVAFLGDYIYEGRPTPTALRQHDGVGEPLTLDDYRARHARYRSDLDLQACHAAFPWIVTLDDHELDNNWADEIPQDPAQQPPDQFLARRAAAFRAYWEMMPLSPRLRPSGIDLALYRRFAWGDLLQLDVFDTRQYRSDQPADLAGASNPDATMLGADQERWFARGIKRSRTVWNAIAQQTMVAQNDRRAGPEEVFDFDNWDGYRVPRQRLLGELAKVPNPVVLTGDRHATWICDLRQDFYDPGLGNGRGGADRHLHQLRWRPRPRPVPCRLRPDQGREPALEVHRQHPRLPALRRRPAALAHRPAHRAHRPLAGGPGFDVRPVRHRGRPPRRRGRLRPSG